MNDMRQSILAMDNSLKILSTHYDSKTSTQLKILNEQINAFEKRWTQLIGNLEQCSARVNISSLDFVEKFFIFLVKKISYHFCNKC